MPDIVDRPRQEHTSRYYWEREHEPGERFVPYFWLEFTSQVMILALFLAIMGGLALLWPASLGERANALVTPANTKPEWYYLGVYQWLKVIPSTILGISIPSKIIGILTPILGVGGLVIWPFLDRRPEVLMRRRLFAVAGATLVMVALIVLTVWGYVS